MKVSALSVVDRDKDICKFLHLCDCDGILFLGCFGAFWQWYLWESWVRFLGYEL